MKKFFKYFSILLTVVIVSAVIVVAITFPPVMAGMAAKTVCSCVFLTGRTPESVKEQELKVFPGLSSADTQVNTSDSTVTTKILWKTSKAIYRKGLGCTLLSEQSEETIRSQKFNVHRAPENPDSIAWPTGDAVKDSIIQGVNYQAVQAAIDHAFVDSEREKPIFTHAVVAVYDGRIIGEKYAEGFDKNSVLMGWSMTKSITNALIGILVKEGKLDVNAPAPVAEWKDDERKKITLNNLLQASTGLAWSESYFIPWSNFHRMFIHSDDKGGYASTRQLDHEPGTFFQYSSGTTNILSRMVRQTVGDGDYHTFPYEKLFYKIGMNHAHLEPDASGTFVGSSYGYASARDWARFGMLYLQDGIWNGERILPEGWVSYSTTPGPAAKIRQYGAQIWLNLGNPNDTSEVEFPGLPTESFLFEGFERNVVVIVPSKKLVVVRLGVTHNGNFSQSDLVNGIIDALPE